MSFIYDANTNEVSKKEENALKKHGIIIDGIKPAGNGAICLIAYRLNQPIPPTTEEMKEELSKRADKAFEELFDVSNPNPSLQNSVEAKLTKEKLFNRLVLQYSDPEQAKKVLHALRFNE